jgi:hypothetical protein
MKERNIRGTLVEGCTASVPEPPHVRAGAADLARMSWRPLCRLLHPPVDMRRVLAAVILLGAGRAAALAQEAAASAGGRAPSSETAPESSLSQR